MKVAVTGASGLIGSALVRALRERGDTAIEVGRRGPVAWDPMAGPPPAEALSVDALVHLAGEPVADKPWTEAQKRRIRDSRVLGTRNVVAGLRDASARAAALVCASAVGYYGDRGDEALDESSSAGADFLASVCVEWEREARAAEELGVRVVNLRSGIVLAREAGALLVMARPFRFFVGGPLGDGRQWVPWIHIADEVGLILRAIDDEAIRGPINLTAPNPVRNRDFAAMLGRTLSRPALMPTPRFALRLVLGERVDVLLASLNVHSNVGHTFRFREPGAALNDLLGRR